MKFNSKKIIGAVIILLLLTFVITGSYMKFKPKVANTNLNNNNNSIFTSVKDALSKKMTLMCAFDDEKGITTKSYIKNGAIRVSTSNKDSINQSGDILIKDKKMYMWDLKSKQGFVYDIPDGEDGKVGAISNDQNQSDAYLKMIDKYKDSCKVATIEDSYFSVPNDIKFEDMSKLLENINKQIPQAKPTQ